MTKTDEMSPFSRQILERGGGNGATSSAAKEVRISQALRWAGGG